MNSQDDDDDTQTTVARLAHVCVAVVEAYWPTKDPWDHERHAAFFAYCRNSIASGELHENVIFRGLRYMKIYLSRTEKKINICSEQQLFYIAMSFSYGLVYVNANNYPKLPDILLPDGNLSQLSFLEAYVWENVGDSLVMSPDEFDEWKVLCNDIYQRALNSPEERGEKYSVDEERDSTVTDDTLQSTETQQQRDVSSTSTIAADVPTNIVNIPPGHQHNPFDNHFANSRRTNHQNYQQPQQSIDNPYLQQPLIDLNNQTAPLFMQAFQHHIVPNSHYISPFRFSNVVIPAAAQVSEFLPWWTMYNPPFLSSQYSFCTAPPPPQFLPIYPFSAAVPASSSQVHNHVFAYVQPQCDNGILGADQSYSTQKPQSPPNMPWNNMSASNTINSQRSAPSISQTHMIPVPRAQQEMETTADDSYYEPCKRFSPTQSLLFQPYHPPCL